MADFPKLPRIKQDDENMEKMHCAARRGQTDLVRRLMSSGVDAGIQNKFGCTGLHLACKYGQIGATRELAPHSDLSGLWHGQRPLHLAVASGNGDVANVLIETAREQGRDIASFVNECDEYEVFEIAGQPKHVQGQTALHWVIAQRNLPMVKTLLSLGASPTAKDKNGETPLMRCIEYNFVEEFDILMSGGNLRLESGDRQGRTHLHWCLLYNREEMAKKVLATGHDVALEDQDKNTPWSLAAAAGMPALLDQMLGQLDPFALQQAPFHNGTTVLPERLVWLDWVKDNDAVHNEVIRVLQRRLDNVVKGQGTAQQANRKGPIQVAPSAPVKK
uniref:Ankyrin repeat protein n=1 Tax=Neobodo designis TaxID=312471 RepID=A0A7S1QUK8_NEODS|mmetsp:Transcript_52632/g.162004  ORF Transcript_52632/g.162004 Transcript_52632/m.162004 type:complete len:332 (+) Transcript_52632:46-1041(+)|eukprot:CAMPEP_0174830920 /NCGR_PEP_ID=MMETSP1114-20130205/2803_1 /TAXON_ID=312471 /ORGANISM="Neobodo designis, Strain CCAP 1951/1" /LENGTH=331 /DNA_ID=CAMNT_0016064733 /DNA_START=46 /DNA_END=1041 /DNA_ORIENTATION=-